jgi:DNA-binding transcriptional LysR family regulator
MNDVEVRELRYFIAVAEELNVTRAAARLRVAQPSLSAAIAKLERKLGVTLLERTTRRVGLTAAGAVLLEQARVAVEGFDAAIERTRRHGLGAERLTVAVKPGAGTDLIKGTLRRCAEDPRMSEVHLLFGHPGGPAAAVRAGAADVAVLRAPFDQHGLDVEVLLVEPRIAVLPTDHRLAGRRELHRADLAGEPMPRWAGPNDPAAAAHWTGTDTPYPTDAAHSGEDGIPSAAVRPGDDETSTAAVRPGGNGRQDRPQAPAINEMNQLLDAVALGDAVAYLPVSVADRCRRPDLVFVPVSDLSPSRVVVAWPDSSRSHAVARFVHAAVEVAADHSSWAATDRLARDDRLGA